MTPAQRFIGIVVSLAVYWGLAVLGAGGLAAFFSQPALIALTWVLAALGVAAFFAGGNLSSGEREDRSNRWVIPVFMVLGLALAYLPAYTDRIDFWTVDGNATRWRHPGQSKREPGSQKQNQKIGDSTCCGLG